jgi:hypothetical protein
MTFTIQESPRTSKAKAECPERSRVGSLIEKIWKRPSRDMQTVPLHLNHPTPNAAWAALTKLDGDADAKQRRDDSQVSLRPVSFKDCTGIQDYETQYLFQNNVHNSCIAMAIPRPMARPQPLLARPRFD